MVSKLQEVGFKEQADAQTYPRLAWVLRFKERPRLPNGSATAEGPPGAAPEDPPMAAAAAEDPLEDPLVAGRTGCSKCRFREEGCYV